MNKNSVLEVTRSEKYAKIIRIKGDSFTDILSQKLIERYIREQGGKVWINQRKNKFKFIMKTVFLTY